MKTLSKNMMLNKISTEEQEIVKQVLCTYRTSWVLKNNGDLYGCGNNSMNQQGTYNTNTNYGNIGITSFTKRASNVVQVACSPNVTWYLNNDGELYGVGKNTYGNLTISGTGSAPSIFTKYAENVKQVACSDETTWYIDNNDDLYGCGLNNYGQQGISGYSTISTFTKRAENVKQVACTVGTTYYVTNSGELWGAGRLFPGRISDVDRTEFTLLATNVKKVINFGIGCVLYISQNNELFGVHRSLYPNVDNSTVFQKIADNVQQVWAYSINSDSNTNVHFKDVIFLDENNNLYGYGNNQYGKLGNGTTTAVSSSTPYLIATNVKEANVNYYCVTYLNSNNELWASGAFYNADGTTSWTNHTSPVRLATNVKGLPAYIPDGAYSANAIWYIGTNNSVYNCGSNSYGELGNGYTYEYPSVLTPTNGNSHATTGGLNQDKHFYISVSASTEYSASYPTWKMFDSKTNTYWQSKNVTLPHYIEIYTDNRSTLVDSSNSGANITKISISNSSTYGITGGRIIGYNSSGSETTLKSFTNTFTANASWDITFSSSYKYVKYRLYIDTVNTGKYARITEMVIYATYKVGTLVYRYTFGTNISI